MQLGPTRYYRLAVDTLLGCYKENFYLNSFYRTVADARGQTDGRMNTITACLHLA